jgi:hypothetical protein
VQLDLVRGWDYRTQLLLAPPGVPAVPEVGSEVVPDELVVDDVPDEPPPADEVVAGGSDVTSVGVPVVDEVPLEPAVVVEVELPVESPVPVEVPVVGGVETVVAGSVDEVAVLEPGAVATPPAAPPLGSVLPSLSEVPPVAGAVVAGFVAGEDFVTELADVLPVLFGDPDPALCWSVVEALRAAATTDG